MASKKIKWWGVQLTDTTYVGAFLILTQQCILTPEIKDAYAFTSKALAEKMADAWREDMGYPEAKAIPLPS